MIRFYPADGEEVTTRVSSRGGVVNRKRNDLVLRRHLEQIMGRIYRGGWMNRGQVLGSGSWVGLVGFQGGITSAIDLITRCLGVAVAAETRDVDVPQVLLAIYLSLSLFKNPHIYGYDVKKKNYNLCSSCMSGGWFVDETRITECETPTRVFELYRSSLSNRMSK